MSRIARSCLLIAVMSCALVTPALAARTVEADTHEFLTGPALRGATYTVEQISPSVQADTSTNIGTLGPYYYFLLTNTSGAAQTFSMSVQNIAAPGGWFPQVCIGAACNPFFPFEHEMAAGASDSVGVNMTADSDGVGTFEFYFEVVGDEGQNETFSLTLYAGAAATGVGEFASAGLVPSLRQNSPNPAHGSTRISYALPAEYHVSLKIYDAAGRLVRTLAEGPEGVGDHSVSWDGRDDSGAAMSSGVYFYRLSTPAGTVAKSMTFVR